MAKFKKASEAVGREKIAKLLWLMDFQDDPTGTMETRLLRRLHQIQERNKNPNSTRVRKLIFKLGGKTYVNHPLKSTPLSENHSCSKMMINSYGDRSFEKKQSEMLKKNYGDKNLPSSSSSSSSSSENPNFASGNDNNIIGDPTMEMKDFIKSIGGTEAELVIQKTLTASDCNKNQGRLLIPAIQVKNPGFVAIDEKRKLEMKECISVEVFDPQRRKWMLNLAQWNMSRGNYALRTKWTSLVDANGLKENMVIRVWSFRVDQKLCFAVVRV